MATNGTAPTTGDLLTVASGVSRLSYFYGQLLTQRDLEAEQRYHLGLRRLMQRETFGTGTVAGLGVQPAGASAPASVLVAPGLAMDPEGRELLLVNTVCVAIADAQLTPTTPTPPAPASPSAGDIAAWLRTIWGVSIGTSDIYDGSDSASLFPRLLHAGLTELSADVTSPQMDSFPHLVTLLAQLSPPAAFALRPGQLLRDYLFHALVGTTYLGLRYADRGTDPSPTVLDASCCGDASCHPSRREEGVVIVAEHHPFPAVRDPYREARAALASQFLAEENASPPPAGPPYPLVPQVACHRDLCNYLLGAWRDLPADDACGPGAFPVVPIGRVYWSRFARGSGSGPSRILSVDNCARPFAPGIPPVRALYDLLTQCTTAEQIQPRIQSMDTPNHGQLPASLTVKLKASTALAIAAPATSLTWALYFYPASPVAASAYWASDGTTAGGYTFAPNAFIDPSSPDTIVLAFTLASGSMPPGAYLWRVDLSQEVVAASSRASLDSTPNPPHAVPSGGHATIEPFEAVFYVPVP